MKTYTLAKGGEYIIVMQRIEDASGARDMVGVTDNDNKWIHELSQTHVFIGANNMVWSEPKNVPSRLGAKWIGDNSYAIEYIGESMFILHYGTDDGSESAHLIYDAQNDFEFDPGICGDLEFYNGYTTTLAEGKVKIIGRDGTVVQTNVECDAWGLGFYAEGLFFMKDSFYDITGTKVIDISELLTKYPNGRFFEELPYFTNNGLCKIDIQTSHDTAYRMHIDRNGELVSGPLEMTIVTRFK